MTGPQTEIEIRLWRDEFFRMRQTPEWTDAAMDAADDLLHRYRARYGQSQPTAPAPVWYDDPPRPGEYHVVGLPRVCWVDEDVVYFPEWDRDGERPRIREMSRAGRRVSPIIKPQEPTQ